MNKLCDECATVAHCLKYGCIPKQPAPVPLTDEQARDMPDCWVVIKDDRIIATHDEPCHHDGIQAVRYAPAAQRQWVGLTDEEIEKACVPLGAAMLSFTEVARAIEAKLKEKNNG
jgi:hypothetical protein